VCCSGIRWNKRQNRLQPDRAPVQYQYQDRCVL